MNETSMPVRALALPFGLGSALRHAKLFHPHGKVLTGTLRRTAEGDAGLPVGTCEVTVRLSTALGLPRRVPDVAGLALRLPPTDRADGAWDILLASAGREVVTRCVPLPVLAFETASFSTLMPLQFEGGQWWVRARAVAAPPLPTLDSIVDAVRARPLVFEFEQAEGTGAYVPLAELTLGSVDQSGGDLSFDPIRRTPDSVRPGPEWLRSLRARAYLDSRRGRSDT
ncbi:phosphodiesterase [Rhodococcus sp. BP-316]|uniref:hypothetical protein n=1 Tax=unclassified Rhodococcus (in: high G+C Gram-positive bacteria) TaxID=192944 RepID=UPI00068B455A|nr:MULTISPECIES: hypothetical protein [unclassified Rhodococcus (in: high G+C Gram-positive bacteria)]MBY6683360.1 phosphodiesterase [Rhodococcus sp. BP-316]MBY6707629.1 phosphodiesterase [Rhodococcus sp. BP-241]